jgi:uncharacterized protein DUF4124
MPDRGSSFPSFMSSRTQRLGTKLAIALALCATVPPAHAAVYKCTDEAGKTTYSDLPCDSKSKALTLSDPTKGKKTDPHMCAQLLDELNRLTAEADNSARKGRAESAANANRRKTLTTQYQARCVSISRSK